MPWILRYTLVFSTKDDCCSVSQNLEFCQRLRWLPHFFFEEILARDNVVSDTPVSTMNPLVLLLCTLALARLNSLVWAWRITLGQAFLNLIRSSLVWRYAFTLHTRWPSIERSRSGSCAGEFYRVNKAGYTVIPFPTRDVVHASGCQPGDMDYGKNNLESRIYTLNATVDVLRAPTLQSDPEWEQNVLSDNIASFYRFLVE